MDELFNLLPLKISNHMSEDAIKAEQEIVQAAKRNAKAFGKLYDKYFEGIFSFVYRRTDDEDIAADLTSQTFFKALQNIKKYEFRGLPFSAWLYRIASNEVNKHYRKTDTKALFSVEEGRVLEIMAESVENADEEQLQLLVKLLKELPTAMVEVLELRFFEGKSFKEIAYILEITESGAKMRTYRAIEALKKNFKIKQQENE
ncbi:MAG: sigma-70 family RNA polymerase sigma factor [Bacteroidota bacterium]